MNSISKTVLRVTNVSKVYRLGVYNSGTFYEDLNRWFKKIRGKEIESEILTNELSVKNNSGLVAAIKDINLDVNQGEVIGIIGRNGAGKSTFLKLLSRVTSPSSGGIKYKGRIASLLEVGTGFHPELTGKENIFLNGAILGMSRKEINSKLNSIIEFSGIAKYIDTPVKRYSSGMYVRLAFSVASHLDAEILVIDEVLAVGDGLFQKKCMDKILDIAKNGRTILFVSHNMASIKAICTRGVLLKEGSIFYDGDTDTAIKHYNAQNQNETSTNIAQAKRTNYGSKLRFNHFEFYNNNIDFGERIKFKFKLKQIDISYDFGELDFGFNICDTNHVSLIHISNRFIDKTFRYIDDNKYYTVEIENNLKPGIYYITLYVANDLEILDWLEHQIKFEIQDSNPYNFENTNSIQGIILPDFNIDLCNDNIQ
jgi:lipopolysaccharide transport system ATP-binding protein